MVVIFDVVRNGETIKVKKCTKCLAYKSIETSFRKRRDKVPASHCRACENERNRLRRQKEKEERK